MSRAQGASSFSPWDDLQFTLSAQPSARHADRSPYVKPLARIAAGLHADGFDRPENAAQAMHIGARAEDPRRLVHLIDVGIGFEMRDQLGVHVDRVANAPVAGWFGWPINDRRRIDDRPGMNAGPQIRGLHRRGACREQHNERKRADPTETHRRQAPIPHEQSESEAMIAKLRSVGNSNPCLLSLSVHGLDGQGDALAAADAERDDSALKTVAPH